VSGDYRTPGINNQGCLEKAMALFINIYLSLSQAEKKEIHTSGYTQLTFRLNAVMVFSGKWIWHILSFKRKSVRFFSSIQKPTAILERFFG
jgi:hypothetical protein